MICLSFKYDEYKLKEKITQMVEMYKATFLNMELIGYIEGDDLLSFFITENILPGKKTTYKINWDSGYVQDTINLVTSSSVFSLYEKSKISVVKEWMQKKYGENIKQNLRGHWYLNDKKEDLKCSLTEAEIHKAALDKTYELVCQDIVENLKKLR